MKDVVYGRYAMSTEAIPLSNADHILGVQVSCDKGGNPEWVDLQYQTADGDHEVRQVRMDWLNALALLSMLKCAQLDSGQPFPDDPRGPT